MRYAITGSSGLIGGALAADLAADGHEVVRLVRRPPQSPSEVQWDPRDAEGGLDPVALRGVCGVIHLAGEPIAGRRWTAARKAELRASRVLSTTTLVRALAAADGGPSVLLSGSAIGWYGDTGGRIVDEEAPRGSGFLAELVRDWETAAWPARASGIRVATLRTGVVLSASGGILGPLLLPFRLGLGARLGGGGQYMSWISLPDQVRAIRFLLDQPGLDGPVNLTAPGAVTNAEFTAALAAALGRPGALRVPAPALRIALGEAAAELLADARVTPRKLLGAGFEFLHPEIDAAISAVLRPAVATG